MSCEAHASRFFDRPPPTGEVADLAHLTVGKDTETLKKLKKADDSLASTTFGIFGAGIEEELTALSRTDVRIMHLRMKRACCKGPGYKPDVGFLVLLFARLPCGSMALEHS